MAYWLMKSEPGIYSIDRLRRERVSSWDGVRNYQARNNLRSMKKGDRALFYHSSAAPTAVVGTMEIVREACPDSTQFDPKSSHYDPDSPSAAPRWFQVDVKFVSKFPEPLTLQEIRRLPALRGMVLLKRGRLSVQPVTPAEWAIILEACERVSRRRPWMTGREDRVSAGGSRA